MPGAEVTVRLPDGREVRARVAAVSGDRLELLAEEPAPRPRHSRRRVPRYPVALPCTVSSARQEQDGDLIDLSELGAAVRVDEDPGDEVVTLSIAGPERLTVTATVVAREETLLGRILHCRFEFGDEETRARIGRMVMLSRGRFRERQAGLARRRLGPASA